MKQISKTWNQLPVISRAILSGFFVSSIGVFLWGAMLSAFMSVWVILPISLMLWLFWKFFSGAWGRGHFTASRKAFFRLTSLSPHIWKWGLAGAILFVIIIQASFVVTFRLVDFPAAKFTADYTIINHFPIWAAWAILIAGSVVAGICEEAGFRGYMQVPLEKRYGAVAGIFITSVCFTVIHLSHTWALPILPHIFFASILLGILAFKTGSLIPGIFGHSILDIFDYSFWWTNITGGFHKSTIFKTGIDLHFIVWVLIFSLAVYCFGGVIGQLNKMDKRELNIVELTV